MEERIWDILEKSGFSRKRQYPSLSNSSIFEKIQIDGYHDELDAYRK
jgi:hypothetical protein